MDGFPDESQMTRSEDGTEPIRGGSVGLNRILSMFVDAAAKDTKPRFNAVVLSAFTIFRNVWQTKTDGTLHTMKTLEEGFVRDVNLFLDYFDTYLSFIWRTRSSDKYCPVIIYFPDYKHLPKELEYGNEGQRYLIMSMYKMFLSRHGDHDSEVKKLDHSRCIWIRAGDATYPHKEVVRKFRDITAHSDSLYITGDPICLMTHVPLDWHMSSRLRGINLLESHTARIRKPDEFRFKLDKQGRIPFQSVVHAVFGDEVLVKALVTPKVKRGILETAETEHWLTRSEDDIRGRLSKITDIPLATLRKYDFI